MAAESYQGLRDRQLQILGCDAHALADLLDPLTGVGGSPDPRDSGAKRGRQPEFCA